MRTDVSRARPPDPAARFFLSGVAGAQLDSLQVQLAAAGDESDGRVAGMSDGQEANSIVTLGPLPLPAKVPHSARHALCFMGCVVVACPASGWDAVLMARMAGGYCRRLCNGYNFEI